MGKLKRKNVLLWSRKVAVTNHLSSKQCFWVPIIKGNFSYCKKGKNKIKKKLNCPLAASLLHSPNTKSHLKLLSQPPEMLPQLLVLVPVHLPLPLLLHAISPHLPRIIVLLGLRRDRPTYRDWV